MYLTDEELAAAVEKIMAVVHASLPELRTSASLTVRILSDAEWTKLKRDENRRRKRMK
jgi:hypothetical protein